MNINTLEDAFINIGIEDEKIKIENTMKIEIEKIINTVCSCTARYRIISKSTAGSGKKLCKLHQFI